MLVGLFLAALYCIVRDEINISVIASFTGVGLVAGIIWAEEIRRTVGLLNFHARIIGNSEIDG